MKVDVNSLTATDHVRRGHYSSDTTEYRVLNIGENESYRVGDVKVPAGRYFVNDGGTIVYRADPAVNGSLKEDDEGRKETLKFEAPKTRLMQLIIDGVLDANLPWDLVLLGILIALTLELVGVPSLPFAVGVYLPLAASTPIFIGGMVRWLADKFTRRTEAEGDKSPGVLLSSGYIAGASIAVMIVAFFNFSDSIPAFLDLSKNEAVPTSFREKLAEYGDEITLVAFGLLALILLVVGARKGTRE